MTFVGFFAVLKNPPFYIFEKILQCPLLKQVSIFSQISGAARSFSPLAFLKNGPIAQLFFELLVAAGGIEPPTSGLCPALLVAVGGLEPPTYSL